MLAAEEISRMSKEERIDAIERLWESFEKDGIEFPSPGWHEQVLTARKAAADSADAEWLSIDQLQSRLMDR